MENISSYTHFSGSRQKTQKNEDENCVLNCRFNCRVIHIGMNVVKNTGDLESIVIIQKTIFGIFGSMTHFQTKF